MEKKKKSAGKHEVKFRVVCEDKPVSEKESTARLVDFFMLLYEQYMKEKQNIEAQSNAGRP
jgi:hypothetical protein